MFNVPCLNPMYHVEHVQGKGVFLFSEDDEIWLRGRTCEAIITLLDGKQSVRTIVQHLQPTISAPEIYFVLEEMASRGLLIESQPAISTTVTTFWHALGIDPVIAEDRRRQTRIGLTDLTFQCEPAFQDVLMHAGIETAGDSALHVVLVSDYLDPRLKEINQAHLDSGIPWILFKPVGLTLWLGPVIYPGASACWACLAQRLYYHRALQGGVEEHRMNGSLAIPQPTWPSTLHAALHHASTEVVKWIALEDTHPLVNTVQTLSLKEYSNETHHIVRRPQCEACGGIPLQLDRIPKAPGFQVATKLFTLDGGHRKATPTETLERLGHHLSPISGVIRALDRVMGLPSDIHLFVARHSQPTLSGQLDVSFRNLRNHSIGKGATEAQAQASGLCEALERYSGVFQGDEPRIRRFAADLDAPYLLPNACMHFSQAQFDARESWNHSHPSPFHWIPERFDVSKEADWTPVWSLVNQSVTYIPTAYCYFGYRGPLDKSCLADSNGNAAGNTLEEAMLQGFFELVERDAVSMWWYNRIQRPVIDLDSFSHAGIYRLREAFASVGRNTWALDLTNDLGIPVVAAISKLEEGNREAIAFGLGCHLDPTIAVLRAFSEMAQLLPVLSAQQGEKPYAHDDPVAQQWWQNATVGEQSFLLPDLQIQPSNFNSFVYSETTDLNKDVQYCISLMSEHGMDLLLLDQSRPDIGLPVVKMFAPDLRVFWRRLGPGRLYQIPVALDWIATPRLEIEMNPIPFFL